MSTSKCPYPGFKQLAIDFPFPQLIPITKWSAMSTSLKPFQMKSKSTISPTIRSLKHVLISSPFSKWIHSKVRISTILHYRVSFLKILNNCLSLVCPMSFRPVIDSSIFTPTVMTIFSFNPKLVSMNPP